MSELATVYKHSGRFPPQGLILPLLLLCVLAVPSGFAYSYIVFYIPVIYLNLLATLFYGFAVGFIAARLLKMFKVRNLLVALVVAVLAGLACLYMSWVGHLHALFEDGRFIIWPQDIWQKMLYLYETGSWTLRGEQAVTGVFLALVWLIECGIFVISPAVTVFADLSATPFCEKNNVWLNREEIIDSLALFSDDDMALLGTGDLSPLLHARVKHIHDVAWTSLLLKSSAASEETYTMRMTAVHLKPNKEGVLEEATFEITKDLLIDKAAYSVLRKFADLELRAEEPSVTPQVLPSDTTAADESPKA